MRCHDLWFLRSFMYGKRACRQHSGLNVRCLRWHICVDSVVFLRPDRTRNKSQHEQVGARRISMLRFVFGRNYCPRTTEAMKSRGASFRPGGCREPKSPPTEAASRPMLDFLAVCVFQNDAVERASPGRVGLVLGGVGLVGRRYQASPNVYFPLPGRRK
jgi:hypothetical protein